MIKPDRELSIERQAELVNIASVASSTTCLGRRHRPIGGASGAPVCGLPDAA